jgi:glycosyltransferase involved in cell wall biosynthesis
LLNEFKMPKEIYYPKITIVTPSYNQDKYLEETIKSVVNQGYPNLEYIIIDGGSSDNSVEIIKKYESYLTYWVSEKDEGLYYALQKGFSISTGEIMAWINSDDMYHNKSLFAVAELFQSQPEINWTMGKNTFYTDQGLVFQFEGSQESWSKWRLYDFNKRNFIQQESVFWRKSLWDKAGGYISTDLKLAADFELCTNLIFAGFRFRTGHQKSKDFFNDYVLEVESLIKKEIKYSKDGNYVLFCRLVKILLKIILIKRWRNKLWFRTLKIPRKVLYDHIKGFYFSKLYSDT